MQQSHAQLFRLARIEAEAVGPDWQRPEDRGAIEFGDAIHRIAAHGRQLHTHRRQPDFLAVIAQQFDLHQHLAGGAHWKVDPRHGTRARAQRQPRGRRLDRWIINPIEVHLEPRRWPAAEAGNHGAAVLVGDQAAATSALNAHIRGRRFTGLAHAIAVFIDESVEQRRSTRPRTGPRKVVGPAFRIVAQSKIPLGGKPPVADSVVVFSGQRQVSIAGRVDAGEHRVPPFRMHERLADAKADRPGVGQSPIQCHGEEPGSEVRQHLIIEGRANLPAIAPEGRGGDIADQGLARAGWAISLAAVLQTCRNEHSGQAGGRARCGQKIVAAAHVLISDRSH